MNRTHLHSHLAILALLVLSFLPAHASAPNSYTPTDIIVPEGDYFTPMGMNDTGEVVGVYTSANAYERPVSWRNGMFTNLPLLPGTWYGRARGINNLGQIVGYCGMQACIWENGTVRALPPVAGTASTGAWAINDTGTIVGNALTGPQGSGLFREAVIWKGDTVAKLVPPTAGSRTWARAIDSSGRVAVSWTTGDDYTYEWNPSRWTPDAPNGTTGTMTTLGSWGSSYDINDSGVVSGNVGSWAVLWDGTTGIELDGIAWGHKIALGINNAGVAVGYNESEGYILTAWVAYEPADMRDLNLMLTQSSILAYAGGLEAAILVNNAGQILVQTVANPHSGNYTLLTPSSQPPGPELPAAPVQAFPSSYDGEVYLYWPSVYFTTGYNVKRATVSGGPYTTIATNVSYNGFRDTSVVNGTTYYYVVSSLKDSYESANSPEAAAQPLGAVPSAPASVLATAGSNVVSIDWSSAPNATSYNVKRSTISGGPYTMIASGVTGVAFTDTTVANGTRYYYVVSSRQGTYESSNSTEVSALPLAPPVAPRNLTATAAKGGNSANLVWQQSTSAEIRFNRVYRSTNGGAFIQITQLPARTTFGDTKLARKTTYAYKVTAVNANGQESPFSNTVTVQTK